MNLRGAPELNQLIEALGGTDEIARESAIARLALIGPRAAERLLQLAPAAAPRARAGMLRALEAIGDPRALPIARAALADASPDTLGPAIALLRAALTSQQPAVARDALDIIIAATLDTARSAAVRLAAFEALQVLPADVREAVARNLITDPDLDVRAAATREPRTAPSPAGADPVWTDAVEGRLPASPGTMKQVLAAKRGSARLTELQHVIDHLRLREQGETDAARREEWRAVRGLAHQALAARNSRLALYDLRDSLLDPDRLPVAFLAALEEIGDATCLEPLAAAYDASSRSGDAWWREHVATAFRAIVGREGLTRRHAVVKRAMTRWPDAAADLMGRL